MVVIPPKPPTNTSHTTRTTGQGCRTRPTLPPKGHTTLALPSNHSGGFATIDHRHADDTPQGSAYGSNSPQATNKDEPQHHDKQTKTCRTRPTQPPKGALRILGCGGGVRSVPGIVDSVVGRRSNTGVLLGRLINQNSHVIRVPELCAAPQNVAIPTVRFQRLTYMSGNCVRHF